MKRKILVISSISLVFLFVTILIIVFVFLSNGKNNSSTNGDLSSNELSIVDSSNVDSKIDSSSVAETKITTTTTQPSVVVPTQPKTTTVTTTTTKPQTQNPPVTSSGMTRQLALSYYPNLITLPKSNYSIGINNNNYNELYIEDYSIIYSELNSGNMAVLIEADPGVCYLTPGADSSYRYVSQNNGKEVARHMYLDISGKYKGTIFDYVNLSDVNTSVYKKVNINGLEMGYYESKIIMKNGHTFRVAGYACLNDNFIGISFIVLDKSSAQNQPISKEAEKIAYTITKN